MRLRTRIQATPFNLSSWFVDDANASQLLILTPPISSSRLTVMLFIYQLPRLPPCSKIMIGFAGFSRVLEESHCCIIVATTGTFAPTVVDALLRYLRQ
jgi:hypothetical protein